MSDPVGVNRFARFCTNIRNFHLIGIGGIGMSGLAELLMRLGYQVSGSDLHRSSLTDRLASLGAVIYEGHDPAQIDKADAVVYSAAVSRENSELNEAHARGLLAITRADLLAAFVRQGEGIAVAGTHGKTTTTAMIGQVLLEAGYDPTLIVGGVVPTLGSNVRLGNGSHIVVEADEYNRSFLGMSPALAVLTTVDADHLECFGTQDEIDRAFIAFANAVPCYQPVVLCADDPGIRRIHAEIRRRHVTYGFSENTDVRATQVTLNGFQTACHVHIRGREMGELRLQHPGRYHIANALAAVAIGDLLEIPFAITRTALERFTGVKRRFEIKGTKKGITVIDDYAHHPTEVEALLGGMCAEGRHRVVAVFQPHLYSRTRNFADAFGQSLAQADVIVVTDVYPSREQAIPGITGELIAQAVRDHGGRDVVYIPDKHAVAEGIIDRLCSGDAVVTIGAGDITDVSDEILAFLNG